jgi:hypothetical protein
MIYIVSAIVVVKIELVNNKKHNKEFKLSEKWIVNHENLL